MGIQQLASRAVLINQNWPVHMSYLKTNKKHPKTKKKQNKPSKYTEKTSAAYPITTQLPNSPSTVTMQGQNSTSLVITTSNIIESYQKFINSDPSLFLSVIRDCSFIASLLLTYCQESTTQLISMSTSFANVHFWVVLNETVSFYYYKQNSSNATTSLLKPNFWL